jgi:hypothetical protein
MPLPIRNSALDRYVKFVPNRILKAQELELVEKIQGEMDQHGAGSIYRDGGTLNVKVTIDGNSVSLEPKNPAVPMYVFIAGRFEVLGPVSFSFAGEPNPKVFLNYTVYRVTYNDANTINDNTLIDQATNEKVAELGQLSFTVETVDKSVDTTGLVVDTAIEIAKNQHPILVYELTRDGGGNLQVTDNYERVKAPALGSTDQAGMVRVTHSPDGLALSPFDPAYLALNTRLAALEAIHPHQDWAPIIQQILSRLDAIVIPPPYVPPPEEPFLRIEPDNLDFTDMPYVPGTSVQKTFALVNYGEGDGDYTLDNQATLYGFTVLGQTSGRIKAHSAITFTVVFTPGQAYPTPVGGPVKINNDLICTVTGSTRDALAEEPGFAFNTTSLNFGSIYAGDFKMLQLAITNVGNGSGQYNLQLPAGVFTVSDDGLNPMSRTLAPGGVANIQVVFRPNAEQTFATSLSFAQYGKNACSLGGLGERKPIGPKYEFSPAFVQFSAVKQGTAAVQYATVRNVGDQAGTPDLYLTNATDFAIPGWVASALQPGASASIAVQATAAATGDKGGILAARYNGVNQCSLSASVGAAAAAKFTFSEVTRAFTGVGATAGEQTLTVNVTNTGAAAGTPDIRLTQSNNWFSISYTPALLGIGQLLTVTIKFTPSRDMMANGYPSIAGALSCANLGENTCALSATVVGASFQFLTPQVDGGIVEFDATGIAAFTLKNVGTEAGTVQLTTDPLFTIVGGGLVTLEANETATVQLSFVANDAAFAAKYPQAAALTLYEFIGRIYGAQNQATGSFRGRFRDTRSARFASRPQGGNVVVPIQAPDIQTGAQRSSTVPFYVYNVGNFPGKPTFNQVSGDLSYFTIARFGPDVDIAPGGYGTYILTASGNQPADVTKTAQHSVHEGGFQFSVHFYAVPFQTAFCDSEGNQINSYDFGECVFRSSGETKTAAVYLKRLTATLGESVVSTSVNDSGGTSHAIDAATRTEGSLTNGSIDKIPVYITITLNAQGSLTAHVSATGSVNTLDITATSVWQEPEAPPPAEEYNPGLYMVYTAGGVAWSTDPNMWGKYIDGAEVDDTGVVTGGTPTYSLGYWNRSYL